MKFRYCLLLLLLFVAGCGKGCGTSRPKPEPEPEPDPPGETADGKLPSRPAIADNAGFTFAVVGDNRGESSGKPAPAFVALVRAMREAAPDLVFNTGDIVNGGYKGEDEAHLRKLWKGYKESIAALRMPVYHVPGNHDVFDPVSARVWKELWGPTYYSFDHGCARFIALDTETERNQVSGAQFDWLRGQLASAGKRHVFIFLHKPLFPVGAHFGTSLDAFPAERDRLHQLFVEHRRLIQGVFQGHDHLYNFEEREGVPYFIVAGGGAPLYLPPELGGFFHYLLVRVTPEKVAFEVRKPSQAAEAARKVTRVAPGTLLEGWEHSLFWYTWDQSVGKGLTADHASDGRQGLKVSFDLSDYQWPALLLPLHPARDLRGADRLVVDLYVPENLGNKLSAALSVKGAKKTHDAPPVALRPGWNKVAADLDGAWLPAEDRAAALELQWTLTGTDRQLKGWVVYDNFRAEGKKGGAGLGTLESWEGKLLWGAWNETVRQEASEELFTEGKRGLKVQFDLSRYTRPLLYAPLDPSWDLGGVASLAVDVYAPKETAEDLVLQMALMNRGGRYKAPPVALVPGWNKAAVTLGGAWLPRQARAAVEQVEWRLLTKGKKLKGWVVLDNFRAGPADGE